MHPKELFFLILFIQSLQMYSIFLKHLLFLGNETKEACLLFVEKLTLSLLVEVLEVELVILFFKKLHLLWGSQGLHQALQQLLQGRPSYSSIELSLLYHFLKCELFC